MLLKGDDKDVEDPKSYRPISLLSMIGKLCKKLVSSRINTKLVGENSLSDRQYGFMQGRSTEDAIVDMSRIVAACDDKYAVGILFDIAGAFDNV